MQIDFFRSMFLFGTIAGGIYGVYRVLRHFWRLDECVPGSERTFPKRSGLFALIFVALSATSIVLTVLISILFQAYDGQASDLPNIALAQAIFCLPSAAFHAAVVSFAKPAIRCRTFVTLLGVGLLIFVMSVGAQWPRGVVAGIAEVVLGVIPLSVLGTVSSITMNVSGEPVARDLTLGLVHGRGAMVALILIAAALTRFFVSRSRGASATA